MSCTDNSQGTLQLICAVRTFCPCNARGFDVDHLKFLQYHTAYKHQLQCSLTLSRNCRQASQRLRVVGIIDTVVQLLIRRGKLQKNC